MEDKKRVFIDIPKAAEMLGVSETTIYEHIQKGKLRGIKISRTRFVRKGPRTLLLTVDVEKCMAAR